MIPILEAWKLPRFNPRTPSQAIARAKSMQGNYGWTGLCAKSTGKYYGWGGTGETSANTLWVSQAGRRHEGDRNPPPGALMFWAGGNYGHVAMCIAPGVIISNDIRARGRLDIVPLSEIQQKWGYVPRGWSLPYYPKGWGAESTLKLIPKPKDQIVVSLSKIRAAHIAYKNRGPVDKRKTPDALDVTIMLHREGIKSGGLKTGLVGKGKFAAYKEWQRRYCKKHGIPVNSATCDGIPGSGSLTELVNKHGGRVVK